MVMSIYKKALAVLMKKPIKLWGISLLSMVLSALLTALCGVAIPFLGIALSLLLSTSMTMVYLHGYRGEEVQVLHLFDCFKDWNTIKRVVLGLAWMYLWIFLWSLIPFVGFVFAIIRAYQYRLTPYILITEPDVPLTDAIKISTERTEGYKLKMCLAELLYIVIIWVAILVLGLFASIPYIGVLFGLIMFVVLVAVFALSNLFLGLVQAAFYEEITNAKPAQIGDGTAGYCPNCGQPYASAESAFCSNCGAPKK